MSENGDFEYVVIFVGCNCDHEPEQHGRGSCDVEGCDCKGGWEE